MLDTKELKTITLLYVEDDKMVRTHTLKLFEKIFKKVYVAEDGADGLEVFKKHQDEVEIVVSDINMPNLNGLEMVEKIKDISTHNIPVVFTTAYTDSEYLQNALELKVDKYMSKPLQMKELTITIVDLVVKYRKQRTVETLARNFIETSSKNSQLQNDLGNIVQVQDQKIKHYETLIDNFMFTVVLDKTGNITDTSSKFCNFFGYTKDELIDTSINLLKCNSSEGENFQQLMLKAIHSKKTVASKMSFTAKEGNSIVFDVILTAKYGSDELVNGYSVYLDLA